MNLGITPINFKNNYSSTQNCQRNNQQQNFGALKARLHLHPTETEDIMLNSFTTRRRDSMIDIFTGTFEKIAKRIGLDTDKLDKKGYMVHFFPEAPYSKSMNVFLKDKSNNVVQTSEGLPVFTRVKSGFENETGELFALDIKDLNLDKTHGVK